MDILQLFFPVKDKINPTNPFGTKSQMYTNLGQLGHPGVDFESPSGTPLYAPCDGDAFYVFDKYGGDGLWIRWPSNANTKYNIILYHLYPKGDAQHPFQIPTGQGVVTPVKAGQFLGYTDNSGYPVESNGAHLHVGVMPTDATGGPLDPNNGYLGCVDPSKFWNDLYAEDINATPITQTVQPIVQAANNIVQQIASSSIPTAQKESIAQKVAELLEEIKKILNI